MHDDTVSEVVAIAAAISPDRIGAIVAEIRQMTGVQLEWDVRGGRVFFVGRAAPAVLATVRSALMSHTARLFDVIETDGTMRSNFRERGEMKT